LNRIILITAALLCLLSPAEARHRHRSIHIVQAQCFIFCAAPVKVVRHVRHVHHRHIRHLHLRPLTPVTTPSESWMATATYHTARTSQVVGGRPAGCPTAYCGCGASLHLFGRIIPSLNLAANWFRFPRAAPGPGMAAVRRHHVMILEADLGGGAWRVFDANAGRHLTYVHARSIAGYVIVDPHGTS
jgi:hypothetical protein